MRVSFVWMQTSLLMKNIIDAAILALLFLASCQAFGQSDDFIDHFDDNRMNWLMPESKKITTEFEAGSLVIKSQHKQEGYFIFKPVKRIVARDFDMEVAIRQTSGAKNMAYGIFWGSNPDQSDYSGFFISSNGQYTILNCKNNFFKEVKHWTKTESVLGPRKMNTLRVSRRGRKYEYFVNGQQVFTSRVKDFAGRNAGIVLFGKMQIEIDYVKISYPDELMDALNASGNDK